MSFTLQLARLGQDTLANLNTAYSGNYVRGFFYEITDQETYGIGKSDGSLGVLMQSFNVKDDDDTNYEVNHQSDLKFKSGGLLSAQLQNTNEILYDFDLTGSSAYNVPRVNAGGTAMEWAAPLSVHPDSASLFEIDSQNRLKGTSLAAFNKTVDQTATSLSNYISTSGYDGSQDIDLLVLTAVDDGQGGTRIESWLQTGSAGTTADFVNVSLDLSEAQIKALLSGGEGISYSSASGNIALEYIRKTANLPEFYNGTSWIEIFTSGNIDTDDVAEGTNLYYTQSRFDTAFGAKSTTDLTEGTNLYYTQSRFDTAFGAKSTTDLIEGTNLYYTQSRFDSAFTAKSTTELSEGSNLYYTDTRANSAIDTRVNTQFINDLVGVDADTLGGESPSYYTTPSNMSWGLTSGYLTYYDGSTLSDSGLQLSSGYYIVNATASDGYGAGLQQKTSGSSGGISFFENTTAKGVLAWGGANAIITGALANSLALRSENALHFAANGNNLIGTLTNIGLGLNTTAPSELLEVNGASLFRNTVKIGTSSGNILGYLTYDNGVGKIMLRANTGKYLALGANNTNDILNIHSDKIEASKYYTTSEGFVYDRAFTYPLDINGQARVSHLYAGTGTPYTASSVTIDAGVGKYTGGTYSATQRVNLDLSSLNTYGRAELSFPNAGSFHVAELSANVMEVYTNSTTMTKYITAGAMYLEGQSGGLYLSSGASGNQFYLENAQATLANKLILSDYGSTTYGTGAIAKVLTTKSDGEVMAKDISDVVSSVTQVGVRTVTQTSHGWTFTEPIPVYWNGSSYVKAIADTTTNARKCSELIVALPDGNTLSLKGSGYHTITGHGLDQGEWYCISKTTAGELQLESDLTLGTDVIWRVLYTVDANTILISIGQLYG